MEGLNDLRYSARSLARTPGLAFALLLTIALGIGSNASVYGFVRGLVTPDLPLPGRDGIVSLFTRDRQGALRPVSYEDYLSIGSGVGVLESLGAARESRVRVSAGSRTLTLPAAAVTAGIADLLQLSLDGGVVISDRLRRTEFGASTDVSGERIRVDGADTHVAGVAPDWLDGLYTGRVVDVWTALQEETIRGLDRRSLTFSVIGRLREGTSADDAQRAVNVIREENAIAVLSYTGLTPEEATGLSRLALLLPAAAGVVFLVACANVAAFLLARASARSHETSIRVALGATRGRLGRQLLSDSLLISIAGGALGVLLAFWTASILPALLYDVHAESLKFSPDAVSTAGAAVACAAILVACGLLPLFETRHGEPAAVLQREAGGLSTAMLRLRRGLVAVQMAGCCLLLISTGLLFEGFHTALRTAAGERVGQPILATLYARHGFDRPDLGLDYFRRAEQAVLSLPGISDTAWIDTPPGASAVWSSVRIESPDLPLRQVEMDVVAFTPRSLETVVVPPIAGRMFGGLDRPGSCKVVIVNEEAADQLFDGDAVGRSIRDPAGDLVEIIGVVATRGPETAPASVRPAIYYYARQTAPPAFAGPGIFQVPDRPKVTAAGVLDAKVVSPGYFGAMGFSTTAGETFREEPGPDDCRVGVINQEAAELYFGGNAVGGAVIDPTGRRTEIVGVIRSAPLRASQRRIEPSIYSSMTQDFVPRMTLIIGAREADAAMLGSVRRRLEIVSGGSLLAGGVVTLDAQLARTSLASERIATLLVGAAAVTALGLGVLGIFGAMAELARQRRREFALRIALGAQRWRVTLQVLATGMRLAAAGILAGVLGSLLAARWLAQIAPDTGASVSWVWLAGPLVLLAAVVLASALPARRAQMVDPLTIMRDR